jgi:hypothetical protein
MVRRQLIEFTDLPWCPDKVRRLVTDYLRFALWAIGAHHCIAPLLARLLRRSGARRIVDLCSGASGPVQAVRAVLAGEGLDVPAVLTDRHPNLPVWREVAGAGLDFVAEPVDATAVPAGVAALGGARTLFNCLHHFPPETARAVLGDAVRAGAPVAVFEVTERSARSVIASLLLAPVVFLITPFIRPLTWWRVALTYLVPLAPLCICWDALVSSLRSYTVSELQGLGAGLPGPAYTWEAGQVRARGVPITYLLGWPSAADQ